MNSPSHTNTNPYTPPEPVRVQDDTLPAGATERQRLASDPALSVWVSASAGTGKTAVLTRRVLRLLLPRESGAPGTPAARILCLTFTKAAASEMKLRLTSTLAQWATLPLEAANPKDKSLTTELAGLLGRAPRPDEITAARRLFAAVVDTPGGLRIMTIHAFCTAILGTFPLEAGLPPQFRMLEDGAAADLMTAARNAVLEAGKRDGGGSMKATFDRLSETLTEDSFAALLQATAKERAALRDTLAQHDGPDGLHKTLCEDMGIDPAHTEASIVLDACSGGYDEAGLRASCAALAEGGGAKDGPRGTGIQMWLDAPLAERLRTFDDYAYLYLTSKGELLKQLAVAKAVKIKADVADILTKEAERIIAVRERANTAYCAAMTRDLLALCSAVLAEYQRLKDERAALDFDDLILTTLKLLRGHNMVPWVMFKLDGGIDHVLVDEAQDTNPEQWEIIRLLTTDFFSGDGARADVQRSVFAVGDEKQSIYSFQRAAPEKFAAMRVLFKQAVEAANLLWKDVPLNTSFRTTPPVLRLIDKTFEPANIRAGVSAMPVEHISARAGHAGLATVWPLFVSPPQDKDSLWSPPVTAGDSHRAAAHMARHIAATIKTLLNTKNPEILESRGRPVQPGDVMILVRTRTTFVNQLIRALKVLDIPVAGVDRMVLSEQLVVRDMAAVAQVALLPSDDLTLACVLKSPFVGWTDADLEDLAAYRPPGQTLWDALHARQNSVCTWLARQQHRAGAEHPFEFFCRLAQEPCPADPVSGQHAITARLGAEALDPLEEFLSAALAFESSNIAALQDFLFWLNRSAAQIKREQEEAGGQVRIMTVHGAKGLQAPIVILPDTISRKASLKPGDRLLWPERAGVALPLWAPRTERECAAYKAGKQVMQDRADEESRRLLYVAMTRAEDRLYVAGYRNGKSHGDQSWFNPVLAAIEDMPDARPEPFAYPAVLDSEGRAVDTAPVLRAKQELPPVDKSHAAPMADGAAADPANPALAWLYHPPGPEPMPPQPLIPSRAVAAAEGMAPDIEPPSLSPLSPGPSPQDNPHLRRGTAVHRLLQILPDMAPAARRAAAASWITRCAPDQPATLADDVMAILDHAAFAPLFAEGSLAEVPVTGLTPSGRLVSGQIDRLVITDNEVWVVDYKTNRLPPADESGIPPAYRNQMAAYGNVLSRIYPGRKIRLFLLWTTGPSIMEIVEAA